jgi:demethylphylloquinone reductase
MKTSARIVIIGGGFGGLFTALDVAKYGEVTLISDHDHFVFKPLLYEYLSGEVEAWLIAPHFNELLDDDINFIHGAVLDVDLDNREVIIEGRDYRVQYDVLVVAPGGRTNYWNVPGAEDYTFPFREIAHADALRGRMSEVLDHIPPDYAPQDVRSALTFAIIGGGASGCELATKMSDLLYDACERRALKGEPRILIIEMADEILPGMGDEIREIVDEALKETRVEVHLQTKVVGVSSDSLTVEHNNEQIEIKTAGTVWVAGVQVNPLVEKLPFEKTKNGLIIIEPTMIVKGQENIFALGDVSYVTDIPKTLAGTSQLAFQQAKHLADNIKALVNGKELKPGHFEELGEAVSLGVENAAVLTQGKAFGGHLARQARFALYTTRLPTWHHRLKVSASWFFEGTSPRPIQPLGF